MGLFVFVWVMVFVGVKGKFVNWLVFVLFKVCIGVFGWVSRCFVRMSVLCSKEMIILLF